jgi:hypothetical protein
MPISAEQATQKAMMSLFVVRGMPIGGPGAAKRLRFGILVRILLPIIHLFLECLGLLLV